MVEKQAKHIFISAGETSGDMHAANLVQAVKKISPQIKFTGMGITAMRNAGVDIIVDANDLNVMGWIDVVTNLIKISKAFRTIKKFFRQDKPDLLILVDYAGFNLRLAKIAKKRGIKVLYFISPKIWAWHQSRAKIIKKYVDQMAVIFPFEVDFYKKWGVPVTFVGNPLLKIVKPKLSREEAQKTFNLDPNKQTIGLVPGSRKSEIKHLLPVMLQTAELLQKQNPNLQFLLPLANSITTNELQPYLQSSTIKLQVIQNQTYDVMQVCDAIIATSGTATLEIALMEIPLVIVYKASWLEYQIAKAVIKIPYIGLCNILVGKKIIQELIQYNATPKKISTEIAKILNNTQYRQEMLSNLEEMKQPLKNSPQEEIGQLVVELTYT